MGNSKFNAGDVVIVDSDATVKYTITLLYGNGNAICRYLDKLNEYAYMSIPVVALMKYKRKYDTMFMPAINYERMLYR